MGIKDVINIEDYKDYMLVALDDKEIETDNIDFEQKMGIFFNATDMASEFLSDEINERIKNVTNEELFVMDYNTIPAKYNQSNLSEITDTEGSTKKSRMIVQHPSSFTPISNFKEFINKQISLGKITEEYTTVHDYYIGIGKTEEEIQTEIAKLRENSKGYCTNEILKAQSSIIYPNGEEVAVASYARYCIPYEKGEYKFTIKTTKKVCNLKIKIRDYECIGTIRAINSSMIVQHNMSSMTPQVDKVSIIDINNKKILNITGGQSKLGYGINGIINESENMEISDDLIVTEGEYAQLNYNDLLTRLHQIIPNTEGTICSEMINIKLLSNGITLESKFYNYSMEILGGDNLLG